MDSGSGGALLRLHPEAPAEFKQLLQAAIASHAHTCYVTFEGAGLQEPVLTAHALHWLGYVYDALATSTNPRLPLVPLLACTGWTHERLAQLEGVSCLLTTPRLHSADCQWLERLNSGRPIRLPALELVITPPQAADQQQQQHQSIKAAPPAEPPAEGAEALAAAPAPGLCWQRVAGGGTFDRLHAGHMLLLSTLAAVTSEQAYVGITADALLAAKAERALIQPYEVRAAAAASFMAAVRPGGLAVTTGALTDPKAPTQAELDPGMQAIVVSHETLPGAQRINQGRAQRGFAPLQVVVVPVIGVSVDGHKLSSTALRQQDLAEELLCTPSHPQPP